MKNILLLILLINSSFVIAQKNITSLNSNQRKQELIETLDWIESKTGKNFPVTGPTRTAYSIFSFDRDNPSLITIIVYDFKNDQELSKYNFNLKDIYRSSFLDYSENNGVYLETYENQRLINLFQDNKSLITHKVIFYMDGLVSQDRVMKAWDYAIALAGGGKKILNEKF